VYGGGGGDGGGGGGGRALNDEITLWRSDKRRDDGNN